MNMDDKHKSLIINFLSRGGVFFPSRASSFAKNMDKDWGKLCLLD